MLGIVIISILSLCVSSLEGPIHFHQMNAGGGGGGEMSFEAKNMETFGVRHLPH